MSIKNTRLQTSFNKDVNVTLPFASISSVYFAAKNLENNNKLLPRYFYRYNMDSIQNYPEITYDMDDYIFKVKGPAMKVYKMLLNPAFIQTAKELRVLTMRANGQYDEDEDEDEEPTTLSNLEFNDKIQTIVAKSEHIERMCSITRENFVIGEQISMTPCGHLFKTVSIKEYLTHYGNNCPMCRHEF